VTPIPQFVIVLVDEVVIKLLPLISCADGPYVVIPSFHVMEIPDRDVRLVMPGGRGCGKSIVTVRCSAVV
jgi:hypothetical protein